MKIPPKYKDQKYIFAKKKTGLQNYVKNGCQRRKKI